MIGEGEKKVIKNQAAVVSLFVHGIVYRQRPM